MQACSETLKIVAMFATDLYTNGFLPGQETSVSMDVGSIPASRLKALSSIDIILGGIGVFLDMMGIGVIAAGGTTITAMAGTEAGMVTSGLLILLTALMLVAGSILTGADLDRVPRLTGWLLLIIGGIFVIDMVAGTMMSASEIPATVLWIGIVLSIIGETTLIMGGAYLQRLL